MNWRPTLWIFYQFSMGQNITFWNEEQLKHVDSVCVHQILNNDTMEFFVNNL